MTEWCWRQAGAGLRGSGIQVSTGLSPAVLGHSPTPQDLGGTRVTRGTETARKLHPPPPTPLSALLRGAERLGPTPHGAVGAKCPHSRRAHSPALGADPDLEPQRTQGALPQPSQSQRRRGWGASLLRTRTPRPAGASATSPLTTEKSAPTLQTSEMPRADLDGNAPPAPRARASRFLGGPGLLFIGHYIPSKVEYTGTGEGAAPCPCAQRRQTAEIARVARAL